MILTDVKKIKSLKEKLHSKPYNKDKIEQKILKLESKYVSITNKVNNQTQSIYIDKNNNQVALTDNGDVILLSGNRWLLLNEHLLSYIIAYAVLLLASIPFMFVGLVIPEIRNVTESATTVISLSAIVLIIFTCISCKEAILKKKHLFLIMVLALLMNILSFTNGIIHLFS